VLFSHGWPLSADAWDGQMLFLGQQGYRVIAHDRRSHGRSDQTWDGNHMNQYADDLGELIAALDLRDVVLVGHSTGGGKVAHSIGRHGTSRVAKAVPLGAVPPLMLQGETNPKCTPLAAFDAIRKGVFDNRTQFYKDLALPFYGYNRRVRRCRRAYASRSGSRACWAASRVNTTASSNFRRSTTPRISRRSTCRR
jgi:non-heme chloroperoxidase